MRHTQDQLIAGKSILLIIVICVTLYVISLEVIGKSAASTVNSEQTAYNSKQSLLLATTQVGQNNQVGGVVRDPFARFPKVQEGKQSDLSLVVSNVPPPQVNTAALIPRKNLILTGIVSSDDQRLAVIMSGSKSQSYSLNEMIDTYKLIEITNDSIVLENRTEKLVLQLGAARQKEDKNSAK